MSPPLGRRRGSAAPVVGLDGSKAQRLVSVVGVLSGQSRRPQLIHRRYRRPKRPQVSPEGTLLHIGRRWCPSDWAPSS